MNLKLKIPSAAVVISLIALFVALGGTAYASGLISGSQIKNHSVPEKKLTSAAITSLQGQRGPAGAPGPKGDPGVQGVPGPAGPGATSYNLGDQPADEQDHTLATVDGVRVTYNCAPQGVSLDFAATLAGDKVYLSGDAATGTNLFPVQDAEPLLGWSDPSTVDADVIAWAGSVGTLTRFDLGGYDSGFTCNVWGVITPATPTT